MAEAITSAVCLYNREFVVVKRVTRLNEEKMAQKCRLLPARSSSVMASRVDRPIIKRVSLAVITYFRFAAADDA